MFASLIDAGFVVKSLGLVSFAFFGAGVIYMLRRWPADMAKTYSQNAARLSATRIFYGAQVLVFLALLSAFVFTWLIPRRHLPGIFTASFIVGVAAQAFAGVIPETGGWKAKSHRIAAGVMYFDTLVLVGILALCVHPPADVLVTVALLVMTATVAGALLSERIRQQAVVLQSIHLGAFAAAILMATYLN